MAQWFVLRPTFQFSIVDSREQAMDRLSEIYRRKNDVTSFLMHGEYGELHLPSDQHRLWSPHLSFYIFEQGGKTMIQGRFAPRLDVWTTVWILYLAMAFAAFFSLIMAISQWAIGESTWWHWPGIAAIVSIVGIYTVAQIGQQWSSDQMRSLRSRLDGILEEANIQATEQ